MRRSLSSSHSLISSLRRKPLIGLLCLLACVAWLVCSGASKLVDGSNSLAVRAIQNPPGCCENEDNKPHLLVASYYSVKDHLDSKLLLNNKGPQPLAAYPTLYSMSGERFDVGSVVVDPESFRMIDMQDWVRSAGPQFKEGSIQVFHVGRDLVLGAQVYLADEEHSMSFDEKLVETKSFKSSRLEGLWWMPSQRGEVRLALSNTSDAALTLTVNVDGHTPRRDGNATVELAAHQTRLLDVQDDIMRREHGAMSRYGGISIQHSGPVGALLARAMAQNASTGYSLAIQFSDPAAGKSSKVQGVGLRLGNAGGETLTPVAIVRNVGNETTTVTGRLPYTTENGDSGVASLPDLRLSSGQTEVVDISRSLPRHGHERVNSVGGLEFVYSTRPGSVTITALSISDSGNQVFRVPMWDIYALRSSTGGYPWYIDGNSSTVVYIKNGEDHQQQYFLQVRYLGGIYVIGSKKIERGQTIAYDFRKLRDEQIPDNQGRVIPPYANSGQVHWSKVGPEVGVLLGRSEQADTHSGISSNYACLNCCNDNPDASTFRVSANSASALVGDSHTFTATVEMMNCYTGGNDAPIVVEDVIWSSTNPDVAVVGAGVALAQAPGTTNIKAEWHTNRYLNLPGGGGGNGFEPPFEPIGGSGECDSIGVTYNATPATFTVDTLRVLVPNPPVNESNGSPGVIAGQSFTVVLQAIKPDGNIDLSNSSTVAVSPSRTLDSTEIGLPSTITLSGGQHSASVRLNRVSGTDRGTTFRFTPSGGGQLDLPIYTYFNVTASREGLVGGTTACSHVITPNDHFVALPATGLCGNAVIVRNASSPLTVEATTVRDVGPWYPHSAATSGNPCVGSDDLYWNTGGVPRVLGTSCDANNAAIDLADGTASTMGIGGLGSVLWRFD